LELLALAQLDIMKNLLLILEMLYVHTELKMMELANHVLMNV
jgi:hypothetical protein